MKIDRHGQATILTQDELRRLFVEGLKTERDRALFGVCLFTAARINEACTLPVADTYTQNGSVLPEIIIRKANTKNRLATRTIPVSEVLRVIQEISGHRDLGELQKYLTESPVLMTPPQLLQKICKCGFSFRLLLSEIKS